MRETVQGVKRVSPRRTNVDCYPAFGCMPRRLKMMRWSFDDHSGVGIGLAAPKSASSATSRTLRPIDDALWLHGLGLSEFAMRFAVSLRAAPCPNHTSIVTCLRTAERIGVTPGRYCSRPRAESKRVGTYSTRLETRTKESNMYASRRV